MAWEAAATDGDWRRLGLAHWVLKHRLEPVDPLAPEPAGDKAGLLRALIDEKPLSQSEAMELLS
jgi:hypothetical protein